MLSYCLKCRKNAESKNPSDFRTKHGRRMFLLKCACVIVKVQSFSKSKNHISYHIYLFRQS